MKALLKITILTSLIFSSKINAQELGEKYYDNGTKNYTGITSAQGAITNTDKAYYFNGAADFSTGITIANLKEVSFAFWYKKTSNSTDLPIITSYNTSGGNHPTHGYKVGIAGGTKVYVLIQGDVIQDKFEVYSEETNLNDEQWHFVVVRFNGFETKQNRVSVYVDNKKVKSALSSNQFDQTTIRESQDGVTKIGSVMDYNGNKSFFAGILDEIRIYSRVISEADIDRLFKLKVN